jgi:Sec-independent protein translocase protein TatA
MDILGVGPLELLFIFLIALIFLGPNDMVKAGRTLGRMMRKVVTSDAWREITRLRTLPNQLMREAGLEEGLKELKDIQKELPKALEFGELNVPGELKPDAKEDKDREQHDLTAWTTPQAGETVSPTLDGEEQETGIQSGEIPSDVLHDQPLPQPEE